MFAPDWQKVCPGTSAFARNPAGEVFHAYSAYANGGDMPLGISYPGLLE